MRALVMERAGCLEMKEIPVGEPENDELLIKTEAATICTSDLNDIKYNPFGIQVPMIMGHEGAGVVVSVGKNIEGFSPGDRIAAHPVMPCGTCGNCRRGLRHLCERMEHLGISRGGVFAEYFCIRADRARKIPDSMDFSTASLMEPVCVCLEGIERANVRQGGTVMIIGDGPFGILISRLLQDYQPLRIILTGRHWFRMNQTPEGVNVINEREKPNVKEEVLRLTDGGGVDSVILCAGREDAVNLGISCLKARGTMSIFSAISPNPKVDMFQVHVKELNLCGACNDMDYLDRAIECLGRKELGLEKLITHCLPFESWRQAFDLADKGKDEALKVTMTF